VWEPLSIALGWAAPVAAGDTVVVLGPGHLGLASIDAAHASGAERIAVAGTSADSRSVRFRVEMPSGSASVSWDLIVRFIRRITSA
jgi:threonine dehydrogenase-like Zn-dependent dehydrogenase